MWWWRSSYFCSSPASLFGLSFARITKKKGRKKEKKRREEVFVFSPLLLIAESFTTAKLKVDDTDMALKMGSIVATVHSRRSRARSLNILLCVLFGIFGLNWSIEPQLAIFKFFFPFLFVSRLAMFFFVDSERFIHLSCERIALFLRSHNALESHTHSLSRKNEPSKIIAELHMKFPCWLEVNKMKTVGFIKMWQPQKVIVEK